ncbi:MAG: YkgJ family cysteine cluster protein [Patescibacteria group bacterium]
MSQKNKELCHDCDHCCNYAAVEIDKPTTKRDYQNVIWLLHHKNVRVYIDEERAWILEFVTPCEFINKDKLCSIYEKRPLMCREYLQEDCVRYSKNSPEKHAFEKAADLIRYLEKKGIDYQFRKSKK